MGGESPLMDEEKEGGEERDGHGRDVFSREGIRCIRDEKTCL
jgi:hypothetical protein